MNLSSVSPRLIDKIRGWTVLDRIESLSDHQYIEIIIDEINMVNDSS